MAPITRSKTYGKKRGTDLVAAFDSLSLTLSPMKECTTAKPRKPRQVLEPITNNELRRHSPSVIEDSQKPLKGFKENGPLTRGLHDLSLPAAIEENSTGKRAPQAMPQKTKISRTRRSILQDAPNSEEITAPVSASQLRMPPNLQPELSALLCLPYIHPIIEIFATQWALWAKTLCPRKIAQGSYASIFRLSLIADPSIYTVWKLMPLKPRTGKGSRQEGATFIDDAAAELKLLEGMSDSPGFVEFRSAQVLRGMLPQGLMEAHEDWLSELGEEDRELLGEAKEYGESQLWLFIEMTYAGTDLETLLRKGFEDEVTPWGIRGDKIDAFQASDIFWGIAEALAHGEEHAEFEHRDLHPGNVCIKGSSLGSEDPLGGSAHCLIPRFTNLEVTLIDYTLSRATLQKDNVENAERIESEVLANSMRDKDLFGQNSEVEIDQMQYDTYRHMQNIMHMHHQGSKEQEGWQSYMPMTNILWLHHILTILLKATGRFDEEWECVGTVMGVPEGRTIFHLDNLRRATEPQRMRLWSYQSAIDLVSYELERGPGESLEIATRSSMSSLYPKTRNS